MRTNDITSAKNKAKHYRETYGWNVIPLRKGTKSAAIKWGQFQDRKVTDEEFEDFDWSGGNVGIITGKTSKLMVVDVDSPKKAERWLEQRGLSFPDTAEVKTYRGRHYYFRIPDGEEIRSKNVKDGEDVVLEVKANGSLVVAPPSVVTHSGIDSGLKWKDQHVYEWERHPDQVRIADCPAWLLEELRKTPERTSHDYDWSKALSGVPEGERDNHVWEMAWRAAYAGIPKEWALRLMLEAADNCTPPFDRGTALKKVARAYATTTTTPPPAPPEGQDSEEVGILMSNVKAEKVNWLWERRVPLGKLTILEGDPDKGKSLITLDLAARVSTGRRLPDAQVGHLDDVEHLENVEYLGGVVIISAEDGLADTIKPRLVAAGANTSRILALTTVPDGEGNEREINIPKDIPTIERAIAKVNAKLVIVDVLSAFMDGDPTKDKDVRKALTPFGRMAERTGCAVVVLRHFTKNVEASALYRGSGGMSVIGAARSGLAVAPHPDDEDLRVLVPQKGNLSKKAKSLVYDIVTEVIENDDGQSIEVPRIEWKGTIDITADELINPAAASKLEFAQSWLRTTLEAGPMLAEDVKARAKSEGIKDATLERAKKRIAKSEKDGPNGEWRWHLQDAQGAQDNQDAQGFRDEQDTLAGFAA